MYVKEDKKKVIEQKIYERKDTNEEALKTG